MARSWIGPWVWDEAPGFTGWRKPALAVASLDLRSVPQCGAAGPTPSGLGLFVTPDAVDLGNDYTNLGTGDPRDRTLSPAQRTAWRTRLGLAETPAGPSLAAVLWQTMTSLADPIGDDRCPPIVPERQRMMSLWLGGVRVFEKRFRAADAEAVPVLDLLRRTYRRMRQDSLDAVSPPEHYRKYLGDLVRKYRLPYRQFQPGDVPDETPLTPETRLAETFNTANSTTLGPSYTWTEYVSNLTGNSFDVSSNRARAVISATAPTARAQADLSSTDHWCQLQYILAASPVGKIHQFGPAIRFGSGSNTCYVARAISASWIPVNGLYFTKCVNGTLTDLNAPSTNVDGTHTAMTQASGSTLITYLDGIRNASLTDTAITTGTRCGMFGYDGDSGAFGGAVGDDWVASDYGSPIFPRRPRHRANTLLRM